MNRKHFTQAALVSALSLFSCLAHAQGPGFPNKPIRVVVPFPPGGGVDVITRMVGDKLGAQWGQPLIIDNKPGAGTLIGASNVSSSPADGYTLLAATADTLSVAAALQSKPIVLPEKTLLPLTQIVRTPLFVAVRTDSPYRTLAEMVDAARHKPGALSYGSAGIGTIHHMTMALFESQARIELKHAAYRGSAPAITDLLSGVIDMAMLDSPAAMPQLKGGKIRVLAISTESRSPIAPDVPTIAEQGYNGFAAMSWMGFAVPVGVPQAVADKLFAGIKDAIESPDVSQKLRAIGLEPTTSKSPADFQAFADSERVRWSAVIKANNIRAD